MGQTMSPWAPLLELNFRWYYYSRFAGLLGTTMGSVALAFAVLGVSDSPRALGLVLAAHSVPMALFLLAGGVIADRMGLMRTIQVSNVVAGVSQLFLAGLVLSGEARLSHLVVLTAVNGVAASISFPAMSSAMPHLVPRDQLQQANVLFSMGRNMVMVLGPALSGVLVVALSPGWALSFAGSMFLVAATALIKVRLSEDETHEKRPSAIRELREGWGYFITTTWLWVVVAAFGVLRAAQQGGFLTLGPVLAEASPWGAKGWGMILSAEAVGLLATAVVMLRVRLERPLFWGMLGASLYAAPVFALGFAADFWVIVIAAFIAGAGIELFGLAWNIAMQENVPSDMLTRASSYDALGSFAAIPLGQLAAGPLAIAFGVNNVIVAAALVMVAAALLTLTSSSVRNLRRVV